MAFALVRRRFASFPSPAGLRRPIHPIVGVLMPRRVLLAPLLLVALAPRSARTQTPATNEPVFRVNVRVEVVDAQVISKKTRQVISSLKREDFEVYEDNV